MRHTLLVSAVALVAAVGCGKSEQQKQAEQAKAAADQIAKGAEQAAAGAQQAAQGAQQGAQAFAKGLEQFAKGLSQMGQAANATVVDYEVLKTMVPEISGWTRGEVRGEQISMGAKVSKASARYEKGDASFTLEITDSSFNQLFLMPLTMFMAAGYEERSDDGYTRSLTLAGSPGFEKWRKQGNDGEVTVVVANRFVVNADGNNVENIDVLKKAVQAVDLGKLAGMK